MEQGQNKTGARGWRPRRRRSRKREEEPWECQGREEQAEKSEKNMNGHTYRIAAGVRCVLRQDDESARIISTREGRKKGSRKCRG